MTRRSYSSQRPSFLSPAAVAVIRRRSKQTIGFLTIAVAVPLAALLATYQSTDPSFNTAINDDPQNLLTFPGALLADILLQIFGLASGLLLPVILVIGGLFLLEKPIHSLKLRIVCFVIGLMSATVVLAAIPNRLGWLKSLGWGGATGELIYLHVQQAVGPILGMGVVGCCGMIFLFAYGYSIGIRPQFWFSVIIKFFEGIRWILTYAQRRSIPQERSEEIPVSAKPVSAKEEPSDSYTPIIVPSVLVEENVETEEKEDHIPFSEIDLSETIIQKKTLKSIVVPQGEDYHLPSVDLLDQSSQKNNIKTVSQESLQQSAEQLETVLQEFGVRGEIVLVSPGPVVTLYELKPAAGIKTSRVIGLADDIARSMSALSARIAVIPGRNVIGIELPNTVRETVYMRDLLLSASYCKTSAQLPLILGKDISGQPVVVDMVRMPHLLVAGTTGSGKSVSINTMIMSILFRLTPEKCRFIMIDPKMLELSIYDGIPHLLTPVVTDPKKAVVALKWAVREMENRYRAMAKLGVRNIDGYNARIQDARTSGELLIRRVQTGFDPDSGKPIFENQSLDVEPLPYIIIVVDEMADLMLVAGKEIEAAVQRLAQMARAAGIHLIMATQRPSVDVITGTIKANFPTRISFQVTSKIDSRTILGEQGAEQLLGQGDMLYMAGGGRVMRVHGPFVRDDEVEQVVQFLKLQGEPTYEESITEEEEGSSEGFEEAHAADPLYQQAIDLVCREGKASTSFVQRYLQIGYNRAARIIEKMEKEGIISPANHAGKREVLR